MAEALIVGLGNPGKSYRDTRHNIGFLAIDAFAQKHRLDWKEKKSFQGFFAEGKVGEDTVRLLKPTTFMNLSGESVGLVFRYFKQDLSWLLILADDVCLGFGQLRIRINSSAGGHNGLKSVEECLGTDRYPRLRIGVGAPKEKDLSDYVLGPFSKEEQALIPEVLERVVRSIEIWLDEGLTSAMNFANIRSSSTPSIGDKNEET